MPPTCPNASPRPDTSDSPNPSDASALPSSSALPNSSALANHLAVRAELESLTTEAFRPELADIDQLPTLDIAKLMNTEDAAVPTAVAAQLPLIADAIDAIAERMARGGRLIYAARVRRAAWACWTRPSARRRSTLLRRRSWA